MTSIRSTEAAVALVLAWGVLAFGAVYDWAIWPVAASVLVLAAWNLRPREWRDRTAAAAALVAGAIAVQVVPLTSPVLAWASPAAHRVASSLDIAFANGITTRHSLSVHPAGTWLALGAFLAGAVWTATCTSILRRPGAAHRLAVNLATLGTVVAVLGLAHKATDNGRVLWFWTPDVHAWNSFGPFVNRNHFAGWMLLALPVAIGLAAGYLQRMRGSRPGVRDRLLWVGSAAGAPLLVTAASVLAMACSLLWTMSRSGIVAAGVGVAVMAVAGIWRSPGSRHRWVVTASSCAVVMGVVAWRGADTLFAWYGRTATLEWRIQLWTDTLPLLRDFWFTGSGLNTYGTLMLEYPRTDLTYLPRAAHNDYLQLALEGGVLVGVPVLILLAALASRMVRALRDPQDGQTWWIRMGAAAGICGMVVQELSEFSLQVPGVALLFATCVALAIHRPSERKTRSFRKPAEHREEPVELVHPQRAHTPA